jgi:hypothetical protein
VALFWTTAAMIRQPSAIPPIASRGTDSTPVRSAAPTPVVDPEPSPVPSARPNPSLTIDPSLGIVVMEFRDHAGTVAATLPTRRELDAYRAARCQAGPMPAAAADGPGSA